MQSQEKWHRMSAPILFGDPMQPPPVPLRDSGLLPSEDEPQLRSSASCFSPKPAESAPSNTGGDIASQGSAQLMFHLLLMSGMCRHGLRILFPPWCCLARGFDPKKDPVLLPSLFELTGGVLKTQSWEWQQILAKKSAGNIAIPLATARWLVGLRTFWVSHEAQDFITLNTPHVLGSAALAADGFPHGSASQPADMFREPLLFKEAFPWFPSRFPWSSRQRRFGLVMQGGAAAHMLHTRGFGDLDFYICSEGGNVHSHRDEAHQLLQCAVMSLREAAARTLLVQRHDRLTCMLDMPDGSKFRVQFLLRIFRFISEILLSADLDVTQVVYHGAADARQGLYLSPLALQAFAEGVLTIRSTPSRTTRRRIRRYIARGFGVRTATLLSLPAFAFTEDDEDSEDSQDGGSSADGMWWLFTHDMINDQFLKEIWNKMMCHTRGFGDTVRCPICVPLETWFGSKRYRQQEVYNVSDHLPHLQLRNFRSTQQFLCKADKCSLPDTSLLSDLLRTT